MSVRALQDYTYYSKYARYNKEQKRRETWNEACDRVMKMHLRRYPQIEEEIRWAFELVREKRVVGSQRALQFGGMPIEKKNERIYNCSYSQCDRLRFFQEAMFLLLCGCGCGFSVQKHHVAKLPNLNKERSGYKEFLIPDSIEGWADALGVLLSSYFEEPIFPEYYGYNVEFNYSAIRPKGSEIASGTGKAPGPEPLRYSLDMIRGLLDRCVKNNQNRLQTLNAYDVVMHSSDCVLSGGQRRCLVEGSRVLTRKNGFKSIEDIVIGDEVSTDKGWRKVKNTFSQGEQKTITIKHQDGELVCTPNHRVAVLVSHTGEFVWKPACELVAGNRLFYKRTICEGIKDELPSWKYIKPLNSTTCKDIKIPQLDEEMAWLIGIIQGDGHVRLKQDLGCVMVAVEGDNLDQANLVKKQLERFGVNVKTRQPTEGDNCFKIHTKSKQLASYLHQHVKQSKTALKIPKFIKEGSVKIREAFLQGLLDSDGSVKVRPQQTVCTIYKQFAKDVQNLYYSLGIATRFQKLSAPTHSHWQQKYAVNIINMCDKSRFQHHVGFKRYVTNAISRLGNGFPVEFFVENRPKYWFKSFCSAQKQANIDAYQRLYGNTNIVPIEVKKIEINDEVVKTYDIEVEDDNCFICEGVLVHNSATLTMFSPDDEDMINAKIGNWFYENPQRGRSNNSAVLIRNETSFADFKKIIDSTRQYGEPGFIFSDNKEFGVNPSLRKGTLVLTKDGIFPIEQLENKEFIVKNLHGQLSKAKCFLSGHNKKLYKITLSGGKSYYATAEHKWPVYEYNRQHISKKETTALKPKDLLPTLTSYNLSFGDKGNYDDGFLVGYLYGDGWITKRKDGNLQYGFIVSSDDAKNGVLEKFIERLQSKIGEFYWTKRIGKSGKIHYETNLQRKSIVEYFKQFGLTSPDYKKNGFTNFIWQESSEEFRRGLIDGLFTTDGTVRINNKNKEISLNSSRIKLVNDIADLLGFYGIKTLVTKKIIDGSKSAFPNGKIYNKLYEVHRVKISDNNSLSHFANIFNLTHQNKNENVQKYKTDCILPTNGLIRIKSIEETDLHEDVWDITVYDETHCFQLSQCITGNCCEIGLFAYDEFGNSGWQFCNLSELNGKKIKSVEDFRDACKAAAIIGTCQAGYADFPYLGEVSERITRREALLGVSITGIMENSNILLDPKIQKEMAEWIKKVNEDIAPKIGVNLAARLTTTKPSGTTSCLLGTSSGIHPHHAKRYFRLVQGNTMEAPLQFFKQFNPSAVERSVWSANKTDEVIRFCVEVPAGAKTKNDLSAIDMLKNVKLTQQNWVEYGTREENCVDKRLRHNVSNTINVKPEEWDEVTDFIYENRQYFAGISLLPMSGDKDYPQAPFTAVYTPREIVQIYGDGSLMASGLVVDGLHAFDNNLWAACDAALGLGEPLKEPIKPENFVQDWECVDEWKQEFEEWRRIHLLWKNKTDWIRRCKQFADRYCEGNLRNCTYLLKDVSNWKLWCDLNREYVDVNYVDMFEETDETRPMENLACSGGLCELR